MPPLYAGTTGALGILKTTDRGATWRTVNAGLPASLVLALVIDPVRPETLYAGTLGFGVASTHDRGTSWSPSGLESRDVNDLAIHLAKPSECSGHLI